MLLCPRGEYDRATDAFLREPGTEKGSVEEKKHHACVHTCVHMCVCVFVSVRARPTAKY
jgi:hypothetical protein